MSWFYELLSVNRSITRAKEELAGLKRQIDEARALRDELSSRPLTATEKRDTSTLLDYAGELKDLRHIRNQCVDMYNELYPDSNAPSPNSKSQFILRKAKIALQKEKESTSAPVVIETLQNEVTVLTERLRAANSLLVDEINKRK